MKDSVHCEEVQNVFDEYFLQNKPPKWWGNKNEEDMKADIEKRKEAQNSDMRFKYVDDSDTDLSDDENL